MWLTMTLEIYLLLLENANIDLTFSLTNSQKNTYTW
jgi:hypothetical protein